MYGDTANWVTINLRMTGLERAGVADSNRAIEYDYPRLKLLTSIEWCQCRSAKAQRNHTGLAMGAFLCLDVYYFARG